MNKFEIHMEGGQVFEVTADVVAGIEEAIKNKSGFIKCGNKIINVNKIIYIT